MKLILKVLLILNSSVSLIIAQSINEWPQLISTQKYLYFEDFENAIVGTPGTLPLNWINETDDDFDWYVDEGGTPSNGTGPEIDHTLGTASGNYLYTESTTPNFPDKVAHLISPTLDISQIPNPGLSFWYHMFGLEMGELHVDIFQNGNWILDIMQPLSGQQQFNQTDPWLQAIVDLSAYTLSPLSIRFRAITGSNYTSDMAIDDVLFTSLIYDPIMVTSPESIIDSLVIGTMDSTNIYIFNNQLIPSTLIINVTEIPDVSWLELSTPPDSILSNQFGTVKAIYNTVGLSPGIYSTLVEISGNDPANPADTLEIALHVFDPPVINVTPSSFNKTLNMNRSVTDSIKIINTGMGPLNFTVSIEDVEELMDFKSYETKKFKINKILDSNRSGSFADDTVPITNLIKNNLPDGYSYYSDATKSSIPELMHYKFNEAGYSATYNYANGFTRVNEFAFLMGGITMGGTGHNGAALIGTGGSSEFDFVNTNWQTNLGTKSWAISLWLNNLQSSTDLRYYFGDNTASDFRCYSGGNAGAGNLILRGPVTDVLVTGVAPGPAEVKFVYDSSVPEIRAYLNGVLNNVVPQNNLNIVGSGPFKIGGYGSSNSMRAGELLDEFKMWNTIPTQFSWLIPDTLSGLIPAGSELDIIFTFDATGLYPGDYSSNIVINSNDPINPNIFIQADLNVLPGIIFPIVYPDILDFGYIFLGNADTMTFEVMNIGTADLVVSDMSVSTQEFTVLDTTPVIITPGMSDTIAVVYRPINSGVHQDSVVLLHSGFSGRDVVYLSGESGGPPIIDPLPVELFGSVSPGGEDSTAFWIYNAGAGILDYELVLGDDPFMEAASYAGQAVDPSVLYSGKMDYAMAVEPGLAPTHSGEAIWDIQLMFSMQSAGENFNAGAGFDGSHFYSTKWTSNLIRKYDNTGNLVQEFSISGVSGLRDLAYDGTYFYGGALANTIFVMDFSTQTLIGTINSPGQTVRSIAYDEDTDAFWVANWSTDITLVDRSGTIIQTIPAATHGITNIYGSAYDNISDGGPYLWLFHQGASGTEAHIAQIDLATGTPTGVTHDVLTDLPTSAPLAGGLFITTDFVSGKATIGACVQGTPDMMICYELIDYAPWVTLSHTMGSIVPADSNLIMVYWHGIGTSDTSYSGYLGIYTNDPVNPVNNILLQLDIITGIRNQDEILPDMYYLHQNYPNPFNPSTTIRYDLKKQSLVKLSIYDILGKKIRTLVNYKESAGYKSVVWDRLNDYGEQVASGIYIYRLEINDQAGSQFIQSRKMVFIK